MRSFKGRWWVAGVFLSVLAASGVAGAADEPATKPAGAKRTPRQIMADLTAASQELQAVAPSLDVLFDEATRTEIAPKAIGPMKKMLAFLGEVADVQPAAKAQMVTARMQFLAMLSLMGDAESVAALEQGAKSADAAEATCSKAAQLLVRWWKTGKDPAEQGKVVDEAQSLVKANATSNELSQIVISMTQQGAANAELKDRVRKLIAEELKSDLAKQFAERLKAMRKLETLVGKPLVIEGLKLDGEKFSSEAWKGKVVLVDFWATWCGPCLQELPRVKKTYADYHEKGLEIVGVSCDQSEDALRKFLENNKDMPWAQLFDKAQPGWHALALQLGVTGIPTMFLIDKKGIVRTVEARQNFEELIPKMLEEK